MEQLMHFKWLFNFWLRGLLGDQKRAEGTFPGGYQGLVSFAHGCVCFTCPGCSQGVWNSACWQVSLTFLYLGRLLVC